MAPALYPEHAGAELHPSLNRDRIDLVFQTGTHPDEDGYSAFEKGENSLAEFLRSKGVKALYVTGLATEYCVKASALDSVRYGFETFIVRDAVAALDSSEGERVLQELEQEGVRLIFAKDVRS